MQTIAVTGAGGFLGRNVLDVLAAAHQIVAVDTMRMDDLGEAKCDVRWESADIRDTEQLATIFRGVDAIIHLAGATPRPGVGGEEAIDINVRGTAAVLRAADQARVSRTLITSSTAVFGDLVYGDCSLTEDVVPAPTSLYGITKVAAECLVAEAERRRPGSHLIARLPALFGPHERETAVRRLMSPQLQMLRAFSRGTPVALPLRGERDWTYAPEASSALVTLLLADKPAHHIYHLGIARTWHLKTLASVARDALGTAPLTLSSKAGTLDLGDDLDRQRVPLDSARFTAEFGRHFSSPFASCGKYLRWLQQAAPGAIHNSNDGRDLYV